MNHVITDPAGNRFVIYLDGDAVYGYTADGLNIDELPAWIFDVRDALKKNQARFWAFS